MGAGQGGALARVEGDHAAAAEAEGAARADEEVTEDHRRRVALGPPEVGGHQVVPGVGEQGDVGAGAGAQAVDVVLAPASRARRAPATSPTDWPNARTAA